VTPASGGFEYHKSSPARTCVLKRPQQLLALRRYQSNARLIFSCVWRCNAISGFQQRAWRGNEQEIFVGLFLSKSEVAKSAQSSHSSKGLPIKFAVIRRTRQPKRSQKPMVNRYLSG
jgi:hypothetical protein